MKPRSMATFGVITLIGSTALAQPAPSAPQPAPGAQQPAPNTTAAAPPFTPAPPPVASTAPAPQAAPPPQTPQYSPGAYPPPGGYSPGGYPGWGSEQVPTAIGPDGRPRLLPLEMKYDSEKGIPPGYRVVEQRRTNIAIAGASIFGGLWIASAIAGGIMEDSGKYSGHHGWPMYLPVVGPFITIASYDASAGGATPLVFVGLGQAAGLAMLIAGMVTREKWLKYQFEPTAALKMTPTVGATDKGGFAGVVGTF